MKFNKSLAKYYRIWLQSALNSAEYCKQRGDFKGAESYENAAKEYQRIVDLHEKAIDFFSIGDNAFLVDSALPIEFRGYK
jgi:hypothetical protein